jgi:Tol biopolymer transport system component
MAGSGVFIANSWFRERPGSSYPKLIFPTRPPGGDISTSLPPLPGESLSTPTLAGGDGTPSDSNLPKGKIAYVCQIFKLQDQDQICIINADGSGQRRLTIEDKIRHFYPSMAPDGKSVLYSSNLDGNFKIYEITLDGLASPVGNTVGFAPEVSPDNLHIAYTSNDGQNDMVWIMDRDGKNPVLLYPNAWDPTWTPDGKHILFATMVSNKPQLAEIGLDGSGFHQISNLPDLRGRSDWSADGEHIVTYSGKPWLRELYMMNTDGSDTHQISPPDGNSQGPSFSPDGQWVVFTAYFDSIGNNNGCEIYIVRIDGTNLKRLTQNNYCDWQPRWGP